MEGRRGPEGYSMTGLEQTVQSGEAELKKSPKTKDEEKVILSPEFAQEIQKLEDGENKSEIDNTSSIIELKEEPEGNYSMTGLEQTVQSGEEELKNSPRMEKDEEKVIISPDFQQEIQKLEDEENKSEIDNTSSIIEPKEEPEGNYSISEPRRSNVGSVIMREVSIGPVDTSLEKRSEWMIDSSKIQQYLGDKIVYRDRLVGDVEKGVNVLAIGAGKGHEMDEMDKLLPGSHIVGVDPHDYQTRPVGKRLEQLAHNAEYLPKETTAENLQGVADKSFDGATLFFVLHNIEQGGYGQVMSEINRVLKDDGYLFVAEDLVDNEEERSTAEQIDRTLNVDIKKQSAQNYKNTEQWKSFFDQNGFEMVEENEQKPDKVKHGFFVLRKKTVVENQ